MATDSRFKQHGNGAGKYLIPRSEEPQQMCKRGVLCGGGGGGGDFDEGGGGAFGGGEEFRGGGQAGTASSSSSSSDPIDIIPTIEITGHRDDSSSPGRGDPQLVAMNEGKSSGGPSVPCALESSIAGWEAGLACSLLEEKYDGKPSAPPPPPPPSSPAAPPKTPSPPPKATAAAPAASPPPAPKIPVPKKNNSGGSLSRPGMVPRWAARA